MLQAYLIVLKHPTLNTSRIEIGYVLGNSQEDAINKILADDRRMILEQFIKKGYLLEKEYFTCVNVLTIDQYNRFLDQITGSD